jgi:ribosomal protein S18 acetylase RimI-like enzyme
VDSYNNLRFELDPRAEANIEDEVIAWGIVCVQRKPRPTNEALTVDASCVENDQARINFFERHGFKRQTSRVLHLARPLATPIASPTLPPGFAIHSVTSRKEADDLAALHRAAFGTPHMTTERRLVMMSTPEYDPQLDLVAVAPDGQLAAYCMVSISAEENSRTGRNDGYTDPVATHPQFRRMGLARALVLTGLNLLRERGMNTAKLSTSSENMAMQRVACSVGFEIESTTVWFSKPVEG